MVAGGAIIWCLVMGVAVYAVLGRRRPQSERFADRFILICGIIVPIVTLASLLAFGLTLLPGARAEGPADLRVHVHAEQFWWRVTYEADGQRIETANEIHLPVDAEVEFVLTSADVIHSFWIPPLGGKMDVIPGRTNVLRLTPRSTGTYRGVCAEFCGLSHALMAFVVEVHPPDAFAAWLARTASDASGSAAPFQQAGCAACHTIRGVTETGRSGPDLTHVASRATIAAGILPTSRAAFLDWLIAADEIKPGVHMPTYAMLPRAEIEALADALVALK